jgi:hypothetical protein
MSPGQTKSIEAAAQAMEERSIGPALGPTLIDTAVLTGANAALLIRFGAGDSGSTLAGYLEGDLVARTVAHPAGGQDLSSELQAARIPIRADRLQSADPGDISALLGRSPEQIVGVPLGAEGAQPAVLYLAFDRPVELDDRYERFLIAVAAQTARALLNKSLVNDLAS